MNLNVAALKDQTHPEHHFSLGQFFGLVLLGLTAYQQARVQGPAAFLDPAILAPFLQGAVTIVHPPAAVPVQPTV